MKSIETEPDAEGTVLRTSLLATKLKYPLIRIEERIVRQAPAGTEITIQKTAMAADHIMVRLQDGSSFQQLEQLAGQSGGHIIGSSRGDAVYLVAFDQPDIDTVPRGIKALAQERALIRFAEPDYLVYTHDVTPNDPRFGELWGLHNTGQSGGTADADIDAPEAWNTTTGNGVLVAVIDTGVDYQHEDLAANIWTNPGEVPGNGIDDDNNGYIDDIHGIDVYNSDTDPADDHGHGSHCSGTIGGVGNNSVGVAGVCWNARIMGLKFLSSGGSGYTSDAIECILYAARMGARVMNNSWGGGGYSQALADAIEVANASNALFCAAAGNDSANNDAIPHYPSSYTNANVIAVAASTRNDTLASFSSYGLTSVDLAAPGASILSTLPGNTYASWNGTSMATPQVSGAGALLLSQNPNLTVAALKAAILENVDLVDAFSGRVGTGGRLNVARALQHIHGISFDRLEYFIDSWAQVTLTDTSLAGNPSEIASLSTSAGDLEPLTLFPIEAGGYVFTNRVWIDYGAPVVSNGALQGVHGTILYAGHTDPISGSNSTAQAQINLSLVLTITTPPTVVDFSVTNFAVEGINNGSGDVSMFVSNAATGEAIAFTGSNTWTAPAVALSSDQGNNPIWVVGTNAFGQVHSDMVVITRFGPASSTNHVSSTGSHVWPYSSWATAATNIAAALTAASTGNVVLVTNGTYAGPPVIIDRPLTLQSVNGPGTTVIDGEWAQGCLTLLANAIVDGFTLFRGRTDYGAGAYIEAGSLRNSRLVSNIGDYYGGGIYFYGNGGTVQQCVIHSNTAYYGGGIEFDGGGSATGCEITDNVASDSGGGADCWGGGQLDNCDIRRNYASFYGGGVECWAGGTLNNCIIMDNEAGYDGGGIESYYWDAGATVSNSMIVANTAGRYGGGMDLWGGGELVNCTVVGNSSLLGGGLYGYYGGLIQNSIVYYNTAPNGANVLDEGSLATFAYTCTTPAPGGTGNISSPPATRSLRDPHLLAGSPCINSGNNALADGTDIDGDPRVLDGVVDIGCDEFVAGPVTGVITVAIGVNATNLAPGYAAAFTAIIEGPASSYIWDMGDGRMFTNMGILTCSWPAAGPWTVVLTAYNDDYPAGLSDTVTVQVTSITTYVDPIGGHVAPFTSWATAATNIQDAIEAAPHGGLVRVTNGVYATGSYVKDVLPSRVGLHKPVAVVSVNGPAHTSIVGQGPSGASAIRCAYLAAGSSLTGFTLTNGYTLTTGYNQLDESGGGAFLDSGGAISNCVVMGNGADYAGGGIFLLAGGIVHGSLVASNAAHFYGGGVFLSEGGTIGQCTIAANTTYYGGGTYCLYGGLVRNSIVYNNSATYGPNNRTYGTEVNFEYSCTTPLIGLPGGAGCIAGPPLFVDTNAANWRLAEFSPCIDAGTNAVAPDTDLDGLHRPLDGDTNGLAVADMGAYEYLPPTLDTDGDGMPDAWEIANGLNPLVPDGGLDADGDGLSNLQEFLRSTDPNNTDTDGDGYSDNVEVQSGSNPLDPASRPLVSIAITGPTSAPTFSTAASAINISGALASHLIVTNLTIQNNRCIAPDVVGIASSWAYIGIPLYSGDNYITVTAFDDHGGTYADTLKATCSGDARYNDVLFSGALVQDIDFDDDLTPGLPITVRWKVLSYVPLRARLGTGSRTDGWFIFKNAEYTGSVQSPWNISGRHAEVYSFQAQFTAPTNTGDFSVWFNHAQMDGSSYMAAVIPDGVDNRPDLIQTKLITRTILAGGTNTNPQSDTSITDTEHPFETAQQSLMRSGGTISAIDIPTNDWVVGTQVTCRWTVLSYVPVYSKLSLLNLTQQQVWIQASGTLIGTQVSSWHIGSQYAKEYTFSATFVVPNQPGAQQIYFLAAQRDIPGSSWMAGNIPAGADSRPVLFNNMYGRFVERDIVSPGP